jgi:hypothetical protein
MIVNQGQRLRVMRRAIIILVIFLAGSVAADAGESVNEVYRDLIRPHGHPRGAAVSQAALDFCYAQTGDIRGLADTSAFKQCMLGRGYKWQRTKIEGKSDPDDQLFWCQEHDC